MDRWCQNKSCPDKKTQGQIRGKKGFKYYQSNRASRYYSGYWCSMGCREEWFKVNATACMNAVGFIDKQILPLDDAWYVEYNWGTYRSNHETGIGEHINSGYHLINKLKGSEKVIRKSSRAKQSKSELEAVAFISLSVILMLESKVRLDITTDPVPPGSNLISALELELIMLSLKLKLSIDTAPTKLVLPVTFKVDSVVNPEATPNVDPSVTAPDSVPVPEVLRVPSTINPSFMFIELESSELKVVP